MIEHGQVEIGSAVSGQSKKLNGFHVLSLGIGGVQTPEISAFRMYVQTVQV